MAGNTDPKKVNFFRCCQAINVSGKKVLVKLLGWFYKGGDNTYLDYLLREYKLSGLNEYIDDSRKYDLKYKTPMEFDLMLIYLLLKLTCNLYDGKSESNKHNPVYMLFEHQIDGVMMKCANLTQMEQSLDSDQLKYQLEVLQKIYEHLINEGGRLSNRPPEEVQRFYEEVSNIFKNDGLPSYSEEALAEIMQEAERVVVLQGKPTVADLTAFCKDLMDQKMFSKVMKRDEREGHSDEENERQTFHKQIHDYMKSVEESRS